MANVEASASVLDVGEPYYDATGRLEGWEGSPAYLVDFVADEQRDSPDSWERLALAVAKAAGVFMSIDERGNVVADDDDDLGEYTPNWVSDLSLTPQGVMVVADMKGMLPRAMGEAMLDTLVEELRRLPFDTRVSGVGEDIHSSGVEWQPPHVQPLADGDQLATPRTGTSAARVRPSFFVIERGVRCVLRDGVPDVVVEYLDTDDGWTTSLADARRFERNQRGTAVDVMNLAMRLAGALLDQAGGEGWPA